MKSSLVFEKLSNTIDADSLKTINIRMADLGNHIIRAAINRLETYKFSSLKEIFPALKSIKDFIESESYLANIFITVSGREDVIADLSQLNKLGIATEVLRQIEPMLSKSGVGIRGTKQFTPKSLRDKIKDKVLKVSLDGSDDKEFGKSMKESVNVYLSTDLSTQDWYAFDDCYGTSEEKYLVKYIESLYPKLQTKYQEIYLVRNEREIRIFDFDSGDAFEPDFLLFMQQKMDVNKYDNIQIFIEPKGGHLAANDIWKEKFMLRLKDESAITFSTQIGGYRIWGMPFYTEQNKIDFDRSLKREFELL
jgi:type III restriction enzyme